MEKISRGWHIDGKERAIQGTTLAAAAKTVDEP